MTEKEINKSSNNLIDDKFLLYKTIKRRILAGFIDFGIVCIILLISKLISELFNNSYSYLINAILSGLLTTLYYIIMVYLYGGTIGKLISGIRVIRYDEEKEIKITNSFLREIVNIFFIFINIVSIIWILSIESEISIEIYNNYVNKNPLLNVISIFSSFYYLIEIITSLTNEKRRSVHDYIGGTVVKIVSEKAKHSILIAFASTLIGFLLFSVIIYININ